MTNSFLIVRPLAFPDHHHSTVLVYCLTLPGGRIVPLSWWGNRFLEMEFGMIYCCCSLQANDEITLKWYTLAENSLLDDGWWYGSLYWGLMAITVKYNNIIARPWGILQGYESWLHWPLGFGLRSVLAPEQWQDKSDHGRWGILSLQGLKVSNSIHTQNN